MDPLLRRSMRKSFSIPVRIAGLVSLCLLVTCFTQTDVSADEAPLAATVSELSSTVISTTRPGACRNRNDLRFPP